MTPADRPTKWDLVRGPSERDLKLSLADNDRAVTFTAQDENGKKRKLKVVPRELGLISGHIWYFRGTLFQVDDFWVVSDVIAGAYVGAPVDGEFNTWNRWGEINL